MKKNNLGITISPFKKKSFLCLSFYLCLLMSWITATLLSAVGLGIYDLTKKHAVSKNAVMPTLFLATLFGSLSYVLFILCFGNVQDVCAGQPKDFLLIALKSLLVAASWTCVYAAMQTMPISLAGPIRATAPLWTFLGATILFGELPTAGQAIGMVAIFAGQYLFAVWGKLEGFAWNGRGMAFIMAGTLLGAMSSLYDKFLLNSLGLSKTFVQFHFSIDLVVIFGLATLAATKLLKIDKTPFDWRWTIPVTGVALIIADALYFHAVSCPDIQISILSLMRRSNIIISFGLGCIIFHERNIKRKALSLGLILAGTLMLTFF